MQKGIILFSFLGANERKFIVGWQAHCHMGWPVIFSFIFEELHCRKETSLQWARVVGRDITRIILGLSIN